MIDFIHGATGMGCLVVALVFLRYHRMTHDRFFAFFALAFAVFAVNRILLSASGDEAEPVLYLVRLLAFLLIVAAIAEKNRAPG